MSEAEQRAAGAAAQGRHAAGSPQSGSRFSRTSSGYANSVDAGYGGSQGYGAGSGYGSSQGYRADSGYSNTQGNGTSYGNGTQHGGSGAGRGNGYGGSYGAGNGYGGSCGAGNGYGGYGMPENQPPRAVSRSEANDVNRYRQMRQAKDESPLRRAVRQGKEQLPGASRFSRSNGSGIGAEAQGMRVRRSFDARRAAKYAKRTLIGLVAIILAFSVVITVRMNSGISLETRAALNPTLPGQPFYMLLVGTDKDEYREENNSTDGIYRTDSIILARVDPIAAKLTLVSIQRDTLVDLGEDYGEQKINSAYAIGGAPMLIKAVSSLANVSISHYAEIDLDQFISVVDAIGGITVNVPVDCYDPEYTGADIKAGVQTLDGDNALKLCRARHAYDQYGAGDYYRTANQRMVLGAILKKSLSGNPFMLFACMNTGSASVTTDLTGFDLIFLGLRFVGFDMSTSLYSALEPTVSSYENNTWYERVNTEAWEKMMNRVDQGLSPYESESEDPTAGIAAGVA